MDFLDFVLVSLNLFILFCFSSLSFIIGFTMGTKRSSCCTGSTLDEDEYCNNNQEEAFCHAQITNADYIRAMTNEELVKYLINFKNTFGEEYEGEMSCLDWLEADATVLRSKNSN